MHQQRQGLRKWVYGRGCRHEVCSCVDLAPARNLLLQAGSGLSPKICHVGLVGQMPAEAGAVSLHQRSLGLQVGIVSAPRVEAGALIEAYMKTSLGSQLWPTVHTACFTRSGAWTCCWIKTHAMWVQAKLHDSLGMGPDATKLWPPRGDQGESQVSLQGRFA